MQILGIDFTSRPARRKPLACVSARLDAGVLRVQQCDLWTSFSAFEAALRAPGPWLAGLDFPFGLAARCVNDLGWPARWTDYIRLIGRMTRSEFRTALDAYRLAQPPGEKEHRRQCDIEHGALSPQKLYGVPVALMLFEGAPRLQAAGITIPGIQPGDPHRVAVETYPGALARRLIGRRRYKHDHPAAQTDARREARQAILAALAQTSVQDGLGFAVDAPAVLAADPTGDQLDALLCAVQAAWAWTRRDSGYGAPAGANMDEGYIASPAGLPAVAAPGALRDGP